MAALLQRGCVVTGSKASIDSALGFLATQQLESGQFSMQYRVLAIRDAVTGEPVENDELSPFCSMYIAHALALSDDPGAREMLRRTLDFLRAEKQPGGLWRYWNRSAPLFYQIPPDADDTSCISHLLRETTGEIFDNEEFLLSNVAPSGLFYTWIIPRAQLSASVRYWKTLLRDMNRGRLFEFWHAGARRDDIDSVVNANVLLYLGERSETKPVVRYLLDVAERGLEAETDRWYRSVPAFYYALARCFSAGISELGDARGAMERGVRAIMNDDGSIGGNALQTSLAACALSMFGSTSSMRDSATGFLIGCQMADGGWETHPFYYDGRPVPEITWGSRSVTTGFALEALLRHARAGRATG